MRPSNFVALLVVFFFVLSLSAPVHSFSGNIRYDKYYDLDGKILLKIQTGEKGSSPAQHKTLVEGRGAFKRDESIYLDPGEIKVRADSNWDVDDRHLRGLSVGSAVKLNPALAGLPDDLAEQVFAVKVDSDPGEEGHLRQDWSASDQVYFDEELSSMFVIDQDAFTSGGTMKRRIDLICPATGVYLFEDAEIDGYARVIDSLQPAAEEDGGDEGDHEGNTTDEGEQEENGSGGEEEFFTTAAETEPDADNPEGNSEDNSEDNPENVPEEQAFVLKSGEFESTVPTDTRVEDLDLDRTISITAEVIEITGIKVKWDSQSVPDYDPEQEGSYIFTGQLHFPEHIIAPDNMVLLYTVHVVDKAE